MYFISSILHCFCCTVRQPVTAVQSQTVHHNNHQGQTGHPARGQRSQNGDDFVPRSLLDEKVQEVLAKDETIQVIVWCYHRVDTWYCCGRQEPRPESSRRHNPTIQTLSWPACHNWRVVGPLKSLDSYIYSVEIPCNKDDLYKHLTVTIAVCGWNRRLSGSEWESELSTTKVIWMEQCEYAILSTW